MTASGHPYDELTPDRVLDAVESIGFACDGRLLALNSFENRVYQVGVSDDPARRFLIAKFYRPNRWTAAQIDEEHAFTRELEAAEIPVVAPVVRDGASLFEANPAPGLSFRFALFPRVGGRAPELEGLDATAWLGRTLGRLHAIGARKPFVHRPTIDLASHVDDPADTVLASPLLPPSQRSRYHAAVEQARDALEDRFDAVGPVRRIRLHGDCHPGNVLWTEQGPLLVDFDDARSGPSVQDLWMLMTGDEAQRAALLDGYSQFREPELAELSLVEPLRLMRQIHYAGWIAQRWEDPAFPKSFPWAGEPRYWEQHVADLLEATERL